MIHFRTRRLKCEDSERQLGICRNPGILCNWFVEYYILPFTRTCFKTHCTVAPHFSHYMQPLFQFREASKFRALDVFFSYGFAIFFRSRRFMLLKHTVRYGFSYPFKKLVFSRKHSSLTSGPMSFLPLAENDWCLKYFDAALYSLCTAKELGSRNVSSVSELLVECVKEFTFKSKIVRSQYHMFPDHSSAERSQFYLLYAQDLMENLTGSNSPSEFHLISLVSKELLWKAFDCHLVQSKIIDHAALVYLAALHFASSEYQTAIDLCSVVFMGQTTHIEDETLNAGCLFFIDDIVRIIGFCLLCKNLNENMSTRKKPIYLDLRLTPKVFAQYLAVISAEIISKQLELNSVLLITALPLDKFVFALLQQKSSILKPSSSHLKAPITESPIGNSNIIVGLHPMIIEERLIVGLVEYALENIASFYSAICTDLGIQCNTADCYRALHLYKCRKYNEVWHLCERILDEPDLQSDLKKFAFANVLLLPPLDTFFDRDVQSLLGLHTLCYHSSPLNDVVRKYNLSDKSTFEHFYCHYNDYHRNPLSHSFDSSKRHYFLGRHFLARYLRLKCCFECNRPCAKTMTDFAEVKCNFPFERLIHQFIVQQVRRILKYYNS